MLRKRENMPLFKKKKHSKKIIWQRHGKKTKGRLEKKIQLTKCNIENFRLSKISPTKNQGGIIYMKLTYTNFCCINHYYFHNIVKCFKNIGQGNKKPYVFLYLSLNMKHIIIFETTRSLLEVFKKSKIW